PQCRVEPFQQKADRLPIVVDGDQNDEVVGGFLPDGVNHGRPLSAACGRKWGGLYGQGQAGSTASGRSRLGRQRRRAGRWCAAAGTHIFGATAGVLVGGDLFQLGPTTFTALMEK